jgi:hypothetical protein
MKEDAERRIGDADVRPEPEVLGAKADIAHRGLKGATVERQAASGERERFRHVAQMVRPAVPEVPVVRGDDEPGEGAEY